MSPTLRRSGWLLPALIGMLLGGIVLTAVAFFRSTGGYPWPDDAVVVADGRPYPVATEGREVWLWADRSVAADPRALCSVNTRDGAEVALRTLDSSLRRTGKLGDYRPVAAVRTTADEVLVTCLQPEGISHHVVPVEPEPRLTTLAGWPPLLAPGVGLSALAVWGWDSLLSAGFEAHRR